MPELWQVADGEIAAGQAAELAVLLGLEARWENLRAARSASPQASPVTGELQAMQRAYDAFRAQLRSYQKRYSPAQAPELLLNTPARLEKWCRQVGNLYLRAGQAAPSSQAHSPAHLLEKAYRWADRLADKMGKDRASRPTPPATAEVVIRDLAALAAWCAGLTQVA